MPKLFIFDAFTLLIREKTVANYALLRCKTFSLKIWLCKIFDKYHVCKKDGTTGYIAFKIWCSADIFHMLFCLEFNSLCLTGVGANLLNGNSGEKLFIIRKYWDHVSLKELRLNAVHH